MIRCKGWGGTVAHDAIEQLMLELVNRARLDPAAEAARQGVALEADLAPGSISADAKQPLAGDATLQAAAQGHSDWMLANTSFSHTGANGSDLRARLVAAGYDLSGGAGWAENLSLWGRAPLDLTAAVVAQFAGLWASAGHRQNTLNGEYREIGIGMATGIWQGTPAAVTTQNFAYAGSGAFVTGVAIRDLDGDGFYDVGEGRGGVILRSDAGMASSAAAGGYGLALAAGWQAVTVTAGGQTTALQLDLAPGNLKLDVLLGADGRLDRLLTSGSLSVTSEAGVRVGVLGLAGVALAGGAGADHLSGGAGNDTLIASMGNDTLAGGAGVDLLRYDGAGFAGVAVELLAGRAQGPGFVHTLSDIENLLGSGGNDTLRGQWLDNAIDGGAGDDDIDGRLGNDTLQGGAGNDTLRGDQGDDWLYGDAGNDLLIGGPGNDRLYGGSGNDTVWAGTGDDLVEVDSGNNDVWGGAGNDTIHGGSGNDTLGGDAGNDLIRAGGGQNQIWAGADGDTVHGGDLGDMIGGGAGDDLIFGGAGDDLLMGGILNGNDTIHGGGGHDTIWGGAGDDLIYGGAGNDRLIADAGWDRLWGGAGADTFEFWRSHGWTRVEDFSAPEGDRIALGRGMWEASHGVLTTQQVIDTFGRINPAGAALDLSHVGTTVVLVGVTSLTGLADHIDFL